MVEGGTGLEDVMQPTLSSLPEDVIQSVGVKAPLPAEDALEAEAWTFAATGGSH